MTYTKWTLSWILAWSTFDLHAGCSRLKSSCWDRNIWLWTWSPFDPVTSGWSHNPWVISQSLGDIAISGWHRDLWLGAQSMVYLAISGEILLRLRNRPSVNHISHPFHQRSSVLYVWVQDREPPIPAHILQSWPFLDLTDDGDTWAPKPNST